MANILVPTDQATIQLALNAAAASGDTIILEDGSHGMTAGANGLIFDVGVTGVVFTDLTIRSQNPRGATIDFTGITDRGLYPGGATGVKIKDVVFGGTPNGANFRTLKNDGGAFTGWEFDGIDVSMVLEANNSAFRITTSGSDLGTGIKIKNIKSTSSYVGYALIDIGQNVATKKDLLIENIDFRVHGGTPTEGIILRNIKGVRVRNVQINDVSGHGMSVISTHNANYPEDIAISNVIVDGCSVGIHTGNTADGSYALGYYAKRVKLHNITVRNTTGYGIEFENGAMDCECVGFNVYNVTTYGIALAEDTERITISNGRVDTASGGAGNAGIIASTNHDHVIVNNTISNFESAFMLALTGGFTITATERNMFKDNVIYNCDYAYSATTTALPTGANAPHMIGPNTVYTPNVAFAKLDSVAKTQAQWEATAAVAPSIDTSDVLFAAEGPSPTNYSVQHALNILAGNIDSTRPMKYSIQHALNIMVGNTAGSPNKYSVPNALNLLI